MARTQGQQQDPRLTVICLKIPPIFHEAQTSATNHRKNSVALYKLHQEAWEIVEEKKGKLKAVGAKAFQDTFFDAFRRTLDIKKGKVEVNAERVAKFVAAYVQHINEKDVENDEEHDEDDLGARFTRALLKFIIEGFHAANKTVRYRSVNALYEMVRFLGTLSTETYGDLKEALIDRLQDKENSIRAEAGASLAILCASEENSADSDDDSDDEAAVPVREALYDLMAYDESAEVRKAIVGHIRVSQESLPHILLRMRDVDASIRKAVFQQVLKARIFHGDIHGPCHPSNLDYRHRLEIMRHGLSDRDPNVCKVAEGLMKDWLEAHERTFHAVKADPDSVYRKEDALIALLGDYNLFKRTPEDLIVLEKLVKCIFKLRTDIRDAIEFGDRKEWETVVLPEKAFITRVFVQHCVEQDINDDNHDILPTVVDMAFLLEQRYDAIMALYEDDSATEVSIARASFVLAELLRTSHFLDYTDHMGTHKMRLVIRKMLSDRDLPGIFIASCLDVLRALSADEKELIRIGIEIVQGLREHATDDEEQAPAQNTGEEEQDMPLPLFNRPRWEMEPEIRQYLDAVDLRALHIARGLFERIDTTFKNLPALSGLYDDLILPMMKYADAALRSGFLNEEETARYQELFEEALCCISLSALVAETIAWMSYTEFKRRVNKEDLADDVRLLLLKGMFDIVLVYRSSLVPKGDTKAFEAVLENLLDQVTSQSSCPAALTIVCQGLAKLVMDGIIHDERSIYRLYAAFIVPETAENAELRQSLHFFFQLYSHLHPYNQEMMAKIFMEVFKEAGDKRKSLDDPGVTMVTPDVLCRLFEEYTAPPGEDAKAKRFRLKDNVHLNMADSILEALFEKQLPHEKEDYIFEKNDKKALFLCLPRLQLPAKADSLLLLRIKVQIDKLRTCHPPRDAVSTNALNKFEANFVKKYAKELELLESEDYDKYEELQEFFRFLDDIIPDDERDNGERGGPVTRGKKRRSMSTTNSEIEDVKPKIEEEEVVPRTQNKRRRVSRLPSDDNGEGPSTSTSPPPPPPSRRQKKKKKLPNPPEVIVISSDSDEEPPAARNPAAKSSSRRQPAREVKEEEDDDEIQDLTEQLSQGVSLAEQTWDSIMDSDPPDEDNDEDEEAEVSRLVADSD